MMISGKDVNKTNKGTGESKTSDVDSLEGKPFFCDDTVDLSCKDEGYNISQIFQTLFLQKGTIQQDLADEMCLDKAYISRIVNAIEIPPLHLRLKIARYFKTDSSLIWRVCDLPNIRKILARQQQEAKE